MTRTLGWHRPVGQCFNRRILTKSSVWPPGFAVFRICFEALKFRNINPTTGNRSDEIAAISLDEFLRQQVGRATLNKVAIRTIACREANLIARHEPGVCSPSMPPAATADQTVSSGQTNGYGVGRTGLPGARSRVGVDF